MQIPAVLERKIQQYSDETSAPPSAEQITEFYRRRTSTTNSRPRNVNLLKNAHQQPSLEGTQTNFSDCMIAILQNGFDSIFQRGSLYVVLGPRAACWPYICSVHRCSFCTGSFRVIIQGNFLMRRCGDVSCGGVVTART